MASDRPNQPLNEQLAEATGLDAVSVARVLEALTEAAYTGAAEGFQLPGLGRLQIVPGKVRKGINPFTGKEATFAAPPEVEFSLNSQAEKAMLAAWDPSKATGDSTTAPTPLPELRLVPHEADLAKVDINIDQAARALCKIGGVPDWIQYPETPQCCGREMLFYGQFDSNLGDPYNLADAGIIYVFFCEECYSTQSVLQFY